MMKPAIILGILLIFIVGCTPEETQNNTVIPSLSGVQDLVLNEQDLQQLGMLKGETECQTEEQTSYSSNLVQYNICFYTINNLNNTEVIIELREFTNPEDLNGSYQYDSSHLYSIQGLISENTFGDQSRFRVNNENDYGGQFNEPGMYYYHLWITKDLYLIHITSSGRSDVKENIAQTGRLILSKFG